jgi:hypothetical protein
LLKGSNDPGAGDPIGTGLVAILSRLGGNVTGIDGMTAELAGNAR